jgi:tetratricopeptide (TPR) repeat protein
MPTILRTALSLLFLSIFSFHVAYAQQRNLQPKYGSTPANEAQKKADKEFIAAMDEHFKGDRKKASEDASTRGWKYLRQNNAQDAMKRFNQAWLLDHANGAALWGMAAISSVNDKTDESLKLFAEAEHYVGTDIDFAVDYAFALGIAAAKANNATLIKEALARFSRLYGRAPQHTLNLQNWAITLFYVGNYAEAWKKIRLAEATPRHAELDKRFIAALEEKMPRP